MSVSMARPERSRGLSGAARYRWSVASRILAASLGGYLVASLFNLALPLVWGRLGGDQPGALLAASMASFLLHALMAVGVFIASSAKRAWAALGLAILLLGLLVMLPLEIR